jgi:hypothetical protein
MILGIEETSEVKTVLAVRLREMRNEYNTSSRKTGRKFCLGYVVVDGIIVLRLLIQKFRVNVWMLLN